MDYQWDYCHEIWEPTDYIDEEGSTDVEETKDEEQDKQ